MPYCAAPQESLSCAENFALPVKQAAAAACRPSLRPPSRAHGQQNKPTHGSNNHQLLVAGTSGPIRVKTSRVHNRPTTTAGCREREA